MFCNVHKLWSLENTLETEREHKRLCKEGRAKRDTPHSDGTSEFAPEAVANVYSRWTTSSRLLLLRRSPVLQHMMTLWLGGCKDALKICGDVKITRATLIGLGSLNKSEIEIATLWKWIDRGPLDLGRLFWWSRNVNNEWPTHVHSHVSFKTPPVSNHTLYQTGMNTSLPLVFPFTWGKEWSTFHNMPNFSPWSYVPQKLFRTSIHI